MTYDMSVGSTTIFYMRTALYVSCMISKWSNRIPETQVKPSCDRRPPKWVYSSLLWWVSWIELGFCKSSEQETSSFVSNLTRATDNTVLWTWNRHIWSIRICILSICYCKNSSQDYSRWFNILNVTYIILYYIIIGAVSSNHWHEFALKCMDSPHICTGSPVPHYIQLYQIYKKCIYCDVVNSNTRW